MSNYRRQLGAAIVTAAVAAVALSTVSPGASLANGPTRTHPPFPPLRIARSVCGFPVLVKSIVNRTVEKTYPDGHITYSGQLKQSMTNLENGHRITLNVSGPGRVYSHGGEYIFEGRGTSWIAQSGFGVPNFLLETHGQVLLNGSSFGLVHGSSRNLCPLLR